MRDSTTDALEAIEFVVTNYLENTYDKWELREDRTEMDDTSVEVCNSQPG